MRHVTVWAVAAAALLAAGGVCVGQDEQLEAQVRRICMELRRKLDKGEEVDLEAERTRLEAMGPKVRALLPQMLRVHKPAGVVANAQFRIVLFDVLAKAPDEELAEYAPKLAAAAKMMPELQRTVRLRPPRLTPLVPAVLGRRYRQVLDRQRQAIRAYNQALAAEARKLSATNATVYQCLRRYLLLLTRGISDRAADAWLKAFRERLRAEDQTVLFMIDALWKALPTVAEGLLTAKGGAAELHAGLGRIAEKHAKFTVLYNYADMRTHGRKRRVRDPKGGNELLLEDGFSVLWVRPANVVPAHALEGLLGMLRRRSHGPIRPPGSPS
jgi:hypothetical protein